MSSAADQGDAVAAVKTARALLTLREVPANPWAALGAAALMAASALTMASAIVLGPGVFLG